MPKRKYDLVELKREYLSWNYESVNSFLIQKWLKTKINWKDVKGRDKEKIKTKEKALNKAMKKAITKQANALEIPMNELMLSKKEAVSKVMQQVLEKDLDIQDLERTIKILRTELGLPTSYSKNENMNTEKIEGIHIIMGKNLIDKKENDKNNV